MQQQIPVIYFLWVSPVDIGRPIGVRRWLAPRAITLFPLRQSKLKGITLD
jgi:hypothetical protein